MLSATLLVTLAVAAAPAARSPAETLRAADAEVRAALAAADPRASLTRLAGGYVDYEELARRSLGKLWARQPAADRARLVEVLRDVVEETYLSRLRAPAAYALRVEQVRRDGKLAVVRAAAVTGAQRIPLEFRMHRSLEGRWLVYDASVGGLGFLDGYQEQFPQLIELGGMNKLLATLEEQRETLRRQAPR